MPLIPFWGLKTAKKWVLRPKSTIFADDKNAIKTPFLAVLSPQKGMRGIPIGFWEKSDFFDSIGSLKAVKNTIFIQGGH